MLVKRRNSASCRMQLVLDFYQSNNELHMYVSLTSLSGRAEDSEPRGMWFNTHLGQLFFAFSIIFKCFIDTYGRSLLSNIIIFCLKLYFMTSS